MDENILGLRRSADDLQVRYRELSASAEKRGIGEGLAAVEWVLAAVKTELAAKIRELAKACAQKEQLLGKLRARRGLRQDLRDRDVKEIDDFNVQFDCIAAELDAAELALREDNALGYNPDLQRRKIWELTVKRDNLCRQANQSHVREWFEDITERDGSAMVNCGLTAVEHEMLEKIWAAKDDWIRCGQSLAASRLGGAYNRSFLAARLTTLATTLEALNDELLEMLQRDVPEWNDEAVTQRRDADSGPAVAEIAATVNGVAKLAAIRAE